MLKRLPVLMFLLVFPAAAAAADSASEADIDNVLSRLQGTSGLFGANAAETAQFLGMVNSAELQRITGRLSSQLEAQGGSAETMSLEDAAAFVRQNLTRQDAEALLGISVSDDEFRRAGAAGTEKENLRMLLEMLQSP